jgi:hypothetical protein
MIMNFFTHNGICAALMKFLDLLTNLLQGGLPMKPDSLTFLDFTDSATDIFQCFTAHLL